MLCLRRDGVAATRVQWFGGMLSALTACLHQAGSWYRELIGGFTKILRYFTEETTSFLNVKEILPRRVHV